MCIHAIQLPVDPVPVRPVTSQNPPPQLALPAASLSLGSPPRHNPPLWHCQSANQYLINQPAVNPAAFPITMYHLGQIPTYSHQNSSSRYYVSAHRDLLANPALPINLPSPPKSCPKWTELQHHRSITHSRPPVKKNLPTFARNTNLAFGLRHEFFTLVSRIP